MTLEIAVGSLIALAAGVKLMYDGVESFADEFYIDRRKFWPGLGLVLCAAFIFSSSLQNG
jgi:hypothetical protein